MESAIIAIANAAGCIGVAWAIAWAYVESNKWESDGKD